MWVEVKNNLGWMFFGSGDVMKVAVLYAKVKTQQGQHKTGAYSQTQNFFARAGPYHMPSATLQVILQKV